MLTGTGIWIGVGSAVSYIIFAFIFLGIQYLIDPSLVGWMMRIRRVFEKEEPELHPMVVELTKWAPKFIEQRRIESRPLGALQLQNT